MPDSDWVKYKSVRGKELPPTADWLGKTWALKTTLKFDFYAATGLYESESDGPPRVPERVLFKVYHEDRVGVRALPLDRLGRWLCRREVHYLSAVSGIEGIPRVLKECGNASFVREFVPGKNLREHGKFAGLRDDFFPRLKAILAQVHARGISHNDLSKPENILVAEDGSPVLIDFQIALGAPRRGWLFAPLLRRLVAYFQSVDRYHVQKLHRRYRPFDFSADELAAARRKGLVIRLHGAIRRPYRSVRHFVLNRYLTADNAKEAVGATKQEQRPSV